MLKTNFLDVELSNPLMNASGVHCMTIEELDELANSEAGAFVTKTATRDYRAGNPEPRYYDTNLGSINSMGLPNNGLDYYLDYVIERQKSGAKLQFLSVTGMSYEENVGLLKKIQESEYEGVTEFNLSCPNVPGKPQIAYDFELTDKLLAEVFTFFTKPIGVKLPPYFDIAHFIDLDKEQVVIKPKGGFGGLGGEYIKPTALANVRAFRERLNPSIKIIGTGGVINGKDVFEHILCGADLVQVGTTLHKEGVSVFSRLTKELQEIMKEKGYSSLEDFRGKLKVID